MAFKDKNPGIQDFLNAHARTIFGIGPKDVLLSEEDDPMHGLCIKCREEALPRCTTTAGRTEYKITALCEVCWDATVGGDNELLQKGLET